MKQWLAAFLKNEDRASRIIVSWMAGLLAISFAVGMSAMYLMK
jgi:Flp pilus assembly pilin Flp